jgi:oligosaccharyltransferase complex subunit epsilon
MKRRASVSQGVSDERSSGSLNSSIITSENSNRPRAPSHCSTNYKKNGPTGRNNEQPLPVPNGPTPHQSPNIVARLQNICQSPRSLARPLPFTLFEPISCRQACHEFFQHYSSTTCPMTKIIDAYLLFVLLSGILVFLYGLCTGAVPYHSFLAAFGGTLGSFVLAFNVRLHVTDRNSEPEKECISTERIIAHFLICHIVLFIFVINFIA